MKLKLVVLLFLMTARVINCWSQEDYKVDNLRDEYTSENQHEVYIYKPNELRFKKYPRNIILFIGDGMGIAHVFAGLTANRGQLNIENMVHMGYSKTQSADKYITDSAAGATALSTGRKTNNGAIGVDTEGNKLTNIVELAEANSKSTGVVSTSSITHATPASFIAHQNSRKMYEEIALDFLSTDIDLFIGGGSDFFNKRVDQRNLLNELKDKGYQVFDNLSQTTNIKDGKLAVLTADQHNPKSSVRGEMLTQATSKAIEVLSNNTNKGFFLMVEGSQIDWGGHQNDISYVANEVMDMDRAVGQALKFAVQDRETLVIVTADHETGGLSVRSGNMETGNVSGSFNTKGHTGIMVPVFAFGSGAEEFHGLYENTEIFEKIIKLFRFKRVKF